jgi:hypothetical protein
VLDRKLHYSGAGETDEKTPTAAAGVIILPAETDT